MLYFNKLRPQIFHWGFLFFVRKKNRTKYGSGTFETGAPDTIRTYDLQFRKLSLYPAELRARNIYYFSMVGIGGQARKLHTNGNAAA